jgi:hypothetical protein
LESKNISINFLKVCFCSGGFAAPNRRLLDRKLIFDFQKPFDFVPKYTEKCERSPAAGGASEQTNCPQNSQCLEWSGCRELNPVPLGPEPSVLPMNYTPKYLILANLGS